MLTEFNKTAIRKTVSTINPGKTWEIDDNTVIKNKTLIFECDIPENTDDSLIIRVGHGKECYAATWTEITSTELRVYHKYAEVMCPVKDTHGLTIKGHIKLMIDVGRGKANITLIGNGSSYHRREINWAGRNGLVFAETEGGSIENVFATWWCRDYAKSIYLFGDSYFNMTAPARWPYYLCRDGYDNCFFTGYPGMRSDRGAIDAEISFQRGKPQIAVWCLGMNNPDSASYINADWLKATIDFLSLCKNNNILPIISTIPSTPTHNNRLKNEWVKNSGYRYIDFEKAVGADVDPEWYPGMLHEDKVHPAELGAQALYMQVLRDFPEITL